MPKPDRQYCTAKSKSTGARCKHYAIPGGTVCRNHGGKAAQVVQAAKRRLLAAEAGEQLARLGIIVETTPVEALEAMLWEAAGNVCVLRTMVADLDQDNLYGEMYHDNAQLTGEAKPHVLVVLYNQERDRLAKLAEACAKLGLDERRIRLAESQVAKIVAAAMDAMKDIALSAEQTSRFKQAYATRLRSAS